MLAFVLYFEFQCFINSSYNLSWIVNCFPFSLLRIMFWITEVQAQKVKLFLVIEDYNIVII